MMLKRLYETLCGRRIWLGLKKRYDIDNGIYALLMPEDDAELNAQALKHIDHLAAYRRARGILILTNNRWVKENALSASSKVIDVVDCPPEKIDRLLSAYEFYNFSERFLVVSLTKPYGSNLFKAVGVNGVTKEDLVCLSIFLIRNWSGEGSGNG